MLRKQVFSGLVALSVMSGAVMADSQVESRSSMVEAQQGAVFGIAAVAGGVLGGPVGFIAGALGGAYVGEKIGDAEEVDRMSTVLMAAEDRIEILQHDLAESERRAADIEKFALDILDTQVLFSSGSDVLTESGVARVEALAKVLLVYPQMQVRLDGFADPRGTDEYNNVLSLYRAKAVEDALLEAGVTAERIERYSHGADQSRAAKGDAIAYAAERRVEITVSHPRKEGWACGDC